ncbi:hypothetical protein AMTRI_Chr04g180350 [Amborella trichopoda]|uniref:Secreted protein n=1 Tax=Amborella trichopoda TaxID=13333 RepID=W1PVB5_AMBTC|nr:hypothetical protein AMTR_s00024p00220360 [Amborella trichopoda]
MHGSYKLLAICLCSSGPCALMVGVDFRNMAYDQVIGCLLAFLNDIARNHISSNCSIAWSPREALSEWRSRI